LTGSVGKPRFIGRREPMASENEAIGTIEPDQLIPGRRASRARVIAAGLTDDDIDRLIKQEQQEVESLIR
jgi:hypothetical protein